jgi:ATP-binding cassette subfamily B protein
MNKNKFSSSDLLNFIKPYIENWRTWAGLALTVVFYVTCGRALPILFGKSIDQGIIPEDLSLFKSFCIAFLTVGLLRALIGFYLFYKIRKESNKVSYKVRKHIFEHVLSLKINYFDKNPSGKILTRVANDTKSFQTLLGDGVSGIFISVLELISILAALFITSPILSSVVFFTFPLTFFIGLKLAKKIQTEFFEMKEILSDLNTFLADSLNGFSIVRSYSYFESKNSVFKKMATDYYDRQIEVSKIFALLWPQMDLFQLLTSLACFAIGSYLVQENLLDIGSLIAFTLLIQGFFHPLRFILESLNQVQNGLTSGKRIQRVLKVEPEALGGTEILPVDFNPSVQLKKVNFSYVDSKPLFQNFNLNFESGKTTALTGRTGCGKTTIASLLQNFYAISGGSIKIGGTDIKHLLTESLRSNLCVVRQEDFIFLGSLAENISLSPMAQTDLVKASKALEFSGISKSLDFQVNTSGNNLSPGERQLLSFARIHYLSPKILIFDEATSFIDEKTEALIQQKSKELFKNKTVIIIAHKQTTIDMCENHISL